MEIISSDVVPHIEVTALGTAVADTNKIALIDADTLVVAAAIACAITEEVSPEYYTKEEWADIVQSKGFNLETMELTTLDLTTAYVSVMDRIQSILDNTGCSEYELHFTVGRKSFRYDLFMDYKLCRQKADAPIIIGVPDLRLMLEAKLGSNIVYMHTKYEADDCVVGKYVYDPDAYILCAVDKDVIYSVPGRHWNYYSSAKYNIAPKWIDVDVHTATLHKYMQTLTGDSSDGIPGLHRVGPKTAQKVLDKIDINDPVALWQAVVDKYKSLGHPVGDAIMNMQLVNMHQVVYDGEKFTLTLWKEPGGAV